MSTHKLTDRFVATCAPPKTGRVEYRDTTTPGLWLRVSATGRKTFGVTYRVNGVQRRDTIGKYQAFSLADARKEALRRQREAMLGNDPAAERYDARTGITFGELAERYIEEYARPNKKSWKEDKRVLELDLLPRFRNRPAGSVTRAEVVAVLDRIKSRGAPIKANRTHEIIRRMYNWAINRELVDRNPASNIERVAKDQSRERVLTNEEITRFWNACSLEKDETGARFKLILLTAQRPGEVTSMRWQDIDFGTGWWTIPAEFAKNNRSHRVPLGPTAMALLRNLHSDAKHDKWVFPSPTAKGPVSSNTKPLKRLRSNAGIDDFTAHDLRRTAASKMSGELHVERTTLSKILNHVDRTVTAVYDRHSYDTEKRAALEAWDEWVVKNATQSERKFVVWSATALLDGDTVEGADALADRLEAAVGANYDAWRDAGSIPSMEETFELNGARRPPENLAHYIFDHMFMSMFGSSWEQSAQKPPGNSAFRQFLLDYELDNTLAAVIVLADRRGDSEGVSYAWDIFTRPVQPYSKLFDAYKRQREGGLKKTDNSDRDERIRSEYERMTDSGMSRNEAVSALEERYPSIGRRRIQQITQNICEMK